MTVAELIERLKEMPQDCAVVVYQDTSESRHNRFVKDVILDNNFDDPVYVVELWY